MINHEQATQDALDQQEHSNLARAYLDLLSILVDSSHHDGALKEIEQRWLPIVQGELVRQLATDPIQLPKPSGKKPIYDFGNVDGPWASRGDHED